MSSGERSPEPALPRPDSLSVAPGRLDPKAIAVLAQPRELRPRLAPPATRRGLA
jgi:hypothetical protein